MSKRPESKKTEGEKPEGLAEEDLDQAKGGRANPLIRTKLDGQETTTTNFHDSDFNAAKNRT